jgi:hypothetical protein
LSQEAREKWKCTFRWRLFFGFWVLRLSRMTCGVRIASDDIVHEIEEFDPAPTIFVEALSCRRPVIVTRTEGVRDYLETRLVVSAIESQRSARQ